VCRDSAGLQNTTEAAGGLVSGDVNQKTTGLSGSGRDVMLLGVQFRVTSTPNGAVLSTVLLKVHSGEEAVSRPPVNDTCSAITQFGRVWIPVVFACIVPFEMKEVGRSNSSIAQAFHLS
jgi:hypothetical protein